MAGWYKISAGQGVADLGIALVLDFGLIWQRAGRPKGAVVFSHQSNPEWYLTPIAAEIAYDLIAKYGGSPCPVPVKSDLVRIAGVDLDSKTTSTSD